MIPRSENPFTRRTFHSRFATFIRSLYSGKTDRRSTYPFAARNEPLSLSDFDPCILVIMNSLNGTFWVDPKVKVPGSFTLDTDDSFLLELQGYVFWPEQLDRSNPSYITPSDDPTKIV